MRVLFFLFLPFYLFSVEIAKDSKIYVAGHNGLVGKAILRKLHSEGFHNILTRSSSELDLRSQEQVASFFAQENPEYVFLAAAKVGGIKANSDSPADFLYENLLIECNVIHSAYESGLEKLLFLGSSCIYPRNCPQPIEESYLLTAPLEKTNEGYALAKIAGVKLCEFYNKQYGTNFISCMPTNLYGPHDHFDLETSHVMPALIRKFHEAHEEGKNEVKIWGSGSPKREFLHVDDLADALLFLMENYEEDETINIGYGDDLSIGDLAKLISQEIGYEGSLVFDTSMPDGTPKKLLNSNKIHDLGWYPKIDLKIGVKQTIEWYLEQSSY